MKLCCRNELIKAASDLLMDHSGESGDEVSAELDLTVDWLRRRAARVDER
jgi:hypothetical protein